jgi:hypothetical protein
MRIILDTYRFAANVKKHSMCFFVENLVKNVSGKHFHANPFKGEYQEDTSYNQRPYRFYSMISCPRQTVKETNRAFYLHNQRNLADFLYFFFRHIIMQRPLIVYTKVFSLYINSDHRIK